MSKDHNQEIDAILRMQNRYMLCAFGAMATSSLRLSRRQVSTLRAESDCGSTNQVTVLQQHELLLAHILIDRLIVGDYALAIGCRLFGNSVLSEPRCLIDRGLTSGPHFAAASANFSIGRVRPASVGILLLALCYRNMLDLQ